jgi:hypothetical protein
MHGLESAALPFQAKLLRVANPRPSRPRIHGPSSVAVLTAERGQPDRAAMWNDGSPPRVEPPQTAVRVFDRLFEFAVLQTAVDLIEAWFGFRFVRRIILVHEAENWFLGDRSRSTLSKISSLVDGSRSAP